MGSLFGAWDFSCRDFSLICSVLHGIIYVSYLSACVAKSKKKGHDYERIANVII